MLAVIYGNEDGVSFTSSRSSSPVSQISNLRSSIKPYTMPRFNPNPFAHPRLRGELSFDEILDEIIDEHMAQPSSAESESAMSSRSSPEGDVVPPLRFEQRTTPRSPPWSCSSERRWPRPTPDILAPPLAGDASDSSEQELPRRRDDDSTDDSEGGDFLVQHRHRQRLVGNERAQRLEIIIRHALSYTLDLLCRLHFPARDALALPRPGTLLLVLGVAVITVLSVFPGRLFYVPDNHVIDPHLSQYLLTLRSLLHTSIATCDRLALSADVLRYDLAKTRNWFSSSAALNDLPDSGWLYLCDARDLMRRYGPDPDHYEPLELELMRQHNFDPVNVSSDNASVRPFRQPEWSALLVDPFEDFTIALNFSPHQVWHVVGNAKQYVRFFLRDMWDIPLTNEPPAPSPPTPKTGIFSSLLSRITLFLHPSLQGLLPSRADSRRDASLELVQKLIRNHVEDLVPHFRDLARKHRIALAAVETEVERQERVLVGRFMEWLDDDPRLARMLPSGLRSPEGARELLEDLLREAEEALYGAGFLVADASANGGGGKGEKRRQGDGGGQSRSWLRSLFWWKNGAAGDGRYGGGDAPIQATYLDSIQDRHWYLYDFLGRNDSDRPVERASDVRRERDGQAGGPWRRLHSLFWWKNGAAGDDRDGGGDAPVAPVYLDRQRDRHWYLYNLVGRDDSDQPFERVSDVRREGDGQAGGLWYWPISRAFGGFTLPALEHLGYTKPRVHPLECTPGRFYSLGIMNFAQTRVTARRAEGLSEYLDEAEARLQEMEASLTKVIAGWNRRYKLKGLLWRVDDLTDGWWWGWESLENRIWWTDEDHWFHYRWDRYLDEVARRHVDLPPKAPGKWLEWMGGRGRGVETEAWIFGWEIDDGDCRIWAEKELSALREVYHCSDCP